MRQVHHWPLDELDSMYPFERDIYIVMMQQWLKALAERQKAAAQAAQHK